MEISVGEALAVVRENKHTRYPVYEGTIDKVVGLLLIKDLLDNIDTEEARSASIRALLRPAFIIPETQQLDVLLAQFKENRQQMAVAIDEYGGTLGIVTLEDVLEEIVGELDDEYSTTEMFVHGQDGRTLVNAMAEIDELTDELEFPFPRANTTPSPV